MKENKSILIPKALIWESWLKVKENAGSAGIDRQSIADFEANLGDELYKLWNRLSSGSYFPPPVKAVVIPKRTGGTRVLGIPTVADRIAQTVIKTLIEPRLESAFDPDSYGYRPGRSAHDALTVTRQRCWSYAWVLEYDIKGLFDNIQHDLLMRAVRVHIKEKWIVMYIERWLTAALELEDGRKFARTQGTPQGGVVSPVLSNLFLHYAIDLWARRELSQIPFCRYADDGLFHCTSKDQAIQVLAQLTERLKQCGLEIHPSKTRVVYCRDDKRKLTHENESFEFLGFEYKARPVRNRRANTVFRGFNPAIGKKRLAELKHHVKHGLTELRRTDFSIEDIAKAINPTIHGWLNYYGKFYPSELQGLVWYIDQRLARWAKLKFKMLKASREKSWRLIKRVRSKSPEMFAHWARYRSIMGAV
jgi:RNA-directed DNA polymerase